MSKFQLAILILIVAMICAISIVCIDILRIRAKLDNFYWVAENTHSGMVGMFIREYESLLTQRLVIIAFLATMTALLSLLAYKSFRKLKVRTKSEMRKWRTNLQD